MKGQWIGKYNGTDSGKTLINIDEFDNYFRGVAYLVSYKKELPALAAYFQTNNKNPEFEFRVNNIYTLDPITSLIIDFDKIKNIYPDILIPKNAIINGYFKEDEVSFNIKTDIDTKVEINIKKDHARKDSRIHSEKISWEAYKKKMSEYLNSNMIYRGQNNTT
ncbi:MAG: hypothetical protein P4L27_15025 [Ignavibacteriaceae bacterium]|nr:hypothetical protein [Ignavibacteriaceae bacterium]